MQPDVKELWDQYSATRDTQSRDLLIESYRNLVKYVTGKFCMNARNRLDTIEEGDILQFGMLGLLDAIERFDPLRGVKFETYAVMRITGTIQDELRKLDWVPRSVRQKAREAEKVIQQTAAIPAAAKLTKKEAEAQTAALKKYQELMDQTYGTVIERLNQNESDELQLDQVPLEKEENPEEELANRESRELLTEAITALPERDRIVITLYYYEDLTFKEIAKVLSISESRVFQIHTSVMRKLRERLKSKV